MTAWPARPVKPLFVDAVHLSTSPPLQMIRCYPKAVCCCAILRRIRDIDDANNGELRDVYNRSGLRPLYIFDHPIHPGTLAVIYCTGSTSPMPVRASATAGQFSFVGASQCDRLHSSRAVMCSLSWYVEEMCVDLLSHGGCCYRNIAALCG